MPQSESKNGHVSANFDRKFASVPTIESQVERPAKETEEGLWNRDSSLACGCLSLDLIELRYAGELLPRAG